MKTNDNNTTPRLATFVKALETDRQAKFKILDVRGDLHAVMPVPGHPGHELTLTVQPNRSGTLHEREFVASVWAHRAGQSPTESCKTVLNNGQPLSLAELEDEVSSELVWAAFYASDIPTHRVHNFRRAA
jgi:hypothetical protein